MKECDRVRGVNYLDIIRIIATSMVLIVHLFQYVTISTPPPVVINFLIN